MRGSVVILLACLFATATWAQGIYKWRDAQGHIHYGEAPPEGSQAAEVTVKNSSPSLPPPSNDQRKEKMERLLRTFEEERTQKAEQSAKEAREKAVRKRNCTIARDRLRSFREAGGIYRLQKNGERRVLNDAEHAATIKRVEAEVKKYCK